MDLFKKKIESLYNGLCTVIEYHELEGDINNTESEVVLEYIPCHLSYGSTPNTTQTESGATLLQTIKLFLSSDIVVKPGSKLIIFQNTQKNTYQCTGLPAVYPSHQEIELILEEGWA